MTMTLNIVDAIRDVTARVQNEKERKEALEARLAHSGRKSRPEPEKQPTDSYAESEA